MTQQPQPASTQVSPSPQASVSNNAEIEVTSTPSGADIELDGAFVGNTPSTIAVVTGDHDIAITRAGYKTWTRKIKVSSGKVNISADLESDAKLNQK